MCTEGQQMRRKPGTTALAILDMLRTYPLQATPVSNKI